MQAARDDFDWADYFPLGDSGCSLMQAHFDAHEFERHSHDCFSIGLTTSGVQSFNCDGTLHSSLPGDLILFNPDQAHDGRKGAPGGFGYTMLHLPEAAVESLRDAQAGARFSRHFASPLVRDPALSRGFATAARAARQPGESLRGDELLAQLVTAAFARHGESPASMAAPSSAGEARMDRVRDYLAAHFASDVGIAELAAQVGLSRAHLTRAFARHFGVPPHVYLNAVRLGRARERLMRGERLADVALACGFSDQSHFNRRFRGAMGVTPAQWLRQMRRAQG